LLIASNVDREPLAPVSYSLHLNNQLYCNLKLAFPSRQASGDNRLLI
jgi:hypothetical protein